MATAQVLLPAIDGLRQQYFSAGLRGKYKAHEALVTAELPTTTVEDCAETGYEFDQARFDRQNEEVIARGGLETNIPRGWPRNVHGPLCWTNKTVAAAQRPEGDYELLSEPEESEYVVQLDSEDLAGIRTGLNYFKSLGKETKFATAVNFPLSDSLEGRLAAIRDDVYKGRGFAIVRGLDVDSYSAEDLGTIIFGITSRIGPVRGRQNRHDEIIMHVQNRDDEDEQHNAVTRKPFHTDSVCDVLTLVTRECAVEGGNSLLASGWTVYNELANRAPHVINTLSRGNFANDTFERDPTHYHRALLYCVEDDNNRNPASRTKNIVWCYSRRMLTGALPHSPRTPGIPGLDLRQANAIDHIDATARKHMISTRVEKGDIRFINNMALLHCRESFKDGGSGGERNPTRKRHLLRLWLHNPDHCWQLPKSLRLFWERTFEDDSRGESHTWTPPRGPDGKILRHAGSCD